MRDNVQKSRGQRAGSDCERLSTTTGRVCKLHPVAHPVERCSVGVVLPTIAWGDEAGRECPTVFGPCHLQHSRGGGQPLAVGVWGIENSSSFHLKNTAAVD